MGIDAPVLVDEKMANSGDGGFDGRTGGSRASSYLYLGVLLFAAAVYLGCIISPPSLMDDVDSVQAQIARNMLSSGDWVTARLDGVIYLEKAPLVYWAMALSYKIFGVHDWAARIPIALSAIGLGLLTAAFGSWAFGRRAGFYAGLCVATCIGLFLFTRILIPDVMLTFTVTLAMWAMLRALEEEEPHPRLWAFLLAASLGTGLLLKSLVAVVFPLATGLIFLLVTRQLFLARTWKRLHPFSGLAIVLLIAAPWHILATLRNPPYFDFTFHSGPGQYHGFLWFFFMNEQVLRFLNLRYPRDYNTVPRLYFWLLHLVWLFPWSVYLPAITKLSFKPVDRAGESSAAGAVLDWLRSRIFYVFDDARILLNAVLSRAGSAAGCRHGRRHYLGPSWYSIAGRARWTHGIGSVCPLFQCPKYARAWRYFRRSFKASQSLFTFPGPYGGPDIVITGLSKGTPFTFRVRVSRRHAGDDPSDEPAGFPGDRPYDGDFLSGCPSGHGCIRPVSVVTATSGNALAVSRGQTDLQCSVLRRFVCGFLHESGCSYPKWPSKQS